MKVLITGMTGLIGRHLLGLCREMGVEVHYLTRHPNKIKREPTLKGFFWDPESGEVEKKCLEGVTKIVHLAGASVAQRWTKRQKELILTSREKTGRLLYDLLSNHANDVNQVLSASAIGIYPSSLSRLYTEDTPARADDFLGHVVQRWEAAADRFTALGILVTKVRIGLVLAPDGGFLEQVKKPIKNYMGACLGSGRQWQSWIHIEDLVSLFMYLLQNDIDGVFNGVAPSPVKQRYLLKKIARILKRPLLLPPIPEFVLEFLVGEMSAMILSSQLVASPKIEQTNFKFRFTQVDKALKDLLIQA